MRRSVGFILASVLLVAAGYGVATGPVLADCAEGSSDCVTVEPSVGQPGDTITIQNLRAVCDLAEPIEIELLIAEGVGIAGTAVVHDLQPGGETWGGQFDVPSVVGGGGELPIVIRCVNVLDPGHPSLEVPTGRTLTVVVPPATDTAPPPGPPAWMALVTGLVAFITALRLGRRLAR